MELYIYSRRYEGELEWSQVGDEGQLLAVSTPHRVEEYLNWVNGNKPALILAECDGNTLHLLLFNLPSSRIANGQRYISTTLLFKWTFSSLPTYQDVTKEARALASAYLDPQMMDSFTTLVSDHITDADVENDEVRQQLSQPVYSISDGFLTYLDEIKKDALAQLVSNPTAASASAIHSNNARERIRMTEQLRKSMLPEPRSNNGVSVPLVLVTQNHQPVNAAWQMLTTFSSTTSETPSTSYGTVSLSTLFERGINLGTRRKDSKYDERNVPDPNKRSSSSQMIASKVDYQELDERSGCRLSLINKIRRGNSTSDKNRK